MLLYFFVFFVLFLYALLYIKGAKKFHFFDIPNHRSSHKNKTIVGGGSIFIVAALLCFFYLKFQQLYFTIGLLLLGIVSFIDDIKEVSIPIRIVVQLLAIALLCVEFELSLYFIIPFFVFVFIQINSFNFMDGINGMTGLYGITIVASFFVLNLSESAVSPELILFLLLALLIFSFFNVRKKAVFFAGDVGSISLGFLVAWLLLKFILATESYLLLLCVVVYLVDAGLTFLFRLWQERAQVLKPHKAHLYEQLVAQKKHSHISIALVYSALQLLINCGVYFCYHLQWQLQTIFAVLVVSCLVFTYIYFFKKLKVRTKNVC